MRGWRVTGSLLGLDVALSELALVPLSLRPPPYRPSLNDEDRRVAMQAAIIVPSVRLTNEDRDAIADSIRAGRARLASARTPVDAAAIADSIRLSGTRRALLTWVVESDPTRAARFLSPTELLWLGLDGRPVPQSMQDWGAPAGPRTGSLCVELLDRRPWESVAGRGNRGLLASTLSDLNLRLAELLAELRMPAQLLGPVLTSAALDFVNSAVSRGIDDRRGPIEFINSLTLDRFEQYLGLLTTDGPLVPMSDTSERVGAGQTR
jgi:hypothetical protein